MKRPFVGGRFKAAQIPDTLLWLSPDKRWRIIERHDGSIYVERYVETPPGSRWVPAQLTPAQLARAKAKADEIRSQPCPY